jgi:poly(A) polymerase
LSDDAHVPLPAAAEEVFAECRPIAERFAAAGHRLYLVGGIVRDLFLGRTDGDGDFDFTTDATPAQTKAVLGPIADSLWTQGERFGTIGAHLDTRLVEITTHRAEAYHPDSRKPSVAFSTDVVDDLSRRDFTINALAVEVTTDRPELIDPFGGLRDLGDRRLTTPRSPTESFSDDPLRMMRAARFIARLGVVPEPALLDAIAGLRGRIDVVSAERIRDELDKLLSTEDPTDGLRFLVETGLAARFLPEMSGIDLIATTPCDVELRLAALLLDAGADATAVRLRVLRCPRRVIGDVTATVEVAASLLAHGEEWSDADVRRAVLRADGRLDAAMVVASTRPGGPEASARLRERWTELASREDLTDLRAPLDGDDVSRRLGVAPGPVVGDALRHLLDLRLDEGPLTAGDAVARLDQWWAERGGAD